MCFKSGNKPRECRQDTRGWVLQERLLSPRSWYFGPHSIHWECRKGVVCKNQPFFSSLGRIVLGHGQPPYLMKEVYHTLPKLESMPSWSDARQEFRKCWSQVLDSYSQMNLSSESDKLIAISGITSITPRRLDVQASFGLWLPCLATELLWSAYEAYDSEGLSCRRMNENVPSWSWTSIFGARISNEFLLLAGGWTRLVMVSIEALPSETTFGRPITLIPVDVPPFFVNLRHALL